MKPTQEQVIALAREAGISTPWDQEPVPWKLLTGFATLAYEAGRKDENEACAKVCESGTGEPIQMKALGILLQERKRIAAAIRARREQ